MWFSFRLLCSVLLLCCRAVSFPLTDAIGDDVDSFAFYNESLAQTGEPGTFLEDTLEKRQSRSPELRILPLGASIVYGVGSSNGNGFRKPLRDALRNEGFPVNMVGTRRGGTMKDNDNEATPGAIVSEINTYLKRSLPYKPNVVIINGGTNDCNRQIDVNNIGSRMNSVLNTIWGAPDMSNTCVFLSTLLPTSGVGEGHRLNANEQYRNIVRQRAGDGKCIYLADVDPPSPDPAHNWIALGRDMNSDNIHPNDQGHLKFASIWYRAIMKAADDSKIKQAAKIDTTDKGVGCRKEAGGDIYSNGLTQAGWGLEDGIYSHKSEGMGEVLSILADRDVGQLFFARLFRPDRDDFLEWFEKEPGVHWYGVWKNNGNGNFQKIGDLNPDLFCNPAGVQFIDMNADGLDDLVCINGEGTAYLSINKGDGSGTRPPTFKRISQDAKIKDSEGYPQSQVTMGDIDGDGRGDYLWLDNGGNVWAARNGWVEDKPKYWQNLGLRFEAKGMGDVKGVRFEDINGDGRDDWLWVGNKGETYTWTNARSCKSGRDGDGLNVAWRQAVNPVGTAGGPTHFGMADLGDSDLNRDRIYFARIYGEQSSWGQLAKQDYVYIRHSKEGSKHRFKLNVWKNKGTGGTKLIADGNKYCNMMGHSDGRMDYVWTLSTGAMTLFPNAGRTDMSSGGSFWDAKVDPMWEPQKWTGKNADRRDLHLVDWDGDGTCDIVWTDPDNNNRPQVWINKFPKTGRWEWDYLSNPAPQVECNERRGIALQDLAVQFATLEGKRGDYLCLKKNGTIHGWIHRDDGSWENAGQIKFAEDRDRANLRFADVDGDGADDLIWIDKFNGDGVVSYNMGRGNRADLAGSLFFWEKVSSPSYKGSVAGTCMYYPDLDGNGRADRHEIQGTFNNQAKTYFNPSCSLTDAAGDDGSVSDPNLPKIPGDGNNNGGGGDNGGGGGEGDDLPNNDDPKDDNGVDPICDKTFKDLKDLLDHADDISPACGPEYVLEQVLASFQASFKRFNEILDDGYDGYFKTYSEFLVSSGSSNLNSFMRDNGDKYFECVVTELNPCCTACNLPDYGTCNNCVKECNIESPYDKPERWVDTKLTCPPNHSGWGDGFHKDKTIHWTMKKDKADDFWGELVSTTGAPESKMPITDIQQQYMYPLSASCAREYGYNGGDIKKLPKECYREGFWYDAPKIVDYKTSDVVNPKKTVQNIIKDSDELILGIASIMLSIKAGAYLDEWSSDVVDAVTYPALQVEQALESMEEVVKLAKEIDDNNAKEFMFAFLSAFLAILPMAGGPLASIGLAGLGRSIVYFAELGNIGLAMYGMVSTPESAPLTVFFWLVSARSIMSATNMRNAAKARRDMSPQDLAIFSNVIAQRLAKVDLISKRQGKQPVLCAL